MIHNYTHLPEGEDIGPEGRCYRVSEEIIEYNGRQVLCLHTEARDVTSCCGGYAPYIATTYIVGYIACWKCRTNENGEDVSEIEPITDPSERQGIEQILQRAHEPSSIYYLPSMQGVS